MAIHLSSKPCKINTDSSGSAGLHFFLRKGVRKKLFLGLSPKQRTPPTHPYNLGLFRKLTKIMNK